MLKVLPREEIPDWLFDLRAESIDFRRVFQGSTYYPACDFDLDVLDLCIGFCHSFVYVDRLASKDKVYVNLDTRFTNYRLIFQREYSESEIMGTLPYSPEPVRPSDGRYPGHHPPTQPFFAVLSIFEPVQRSEDITLRRRRRSEASTKVDVAERFSFLYICHEGVRAYEKLYTAHGVCPRAIALINPGYGFGGNWTNFYNQRQIFFRVVQSNPAGLPDFLLIGGNDRDGEGCYKRKCWSPFKFRNFYFRNRNGTRWDYHTRFGDVIVLWSRDRWNETDLYDPADLVVWTFD